MFFPLLCGVSLRKTQNNTNTPEYFKNRKMNPAQCYSQVDLGELLLGTQPHPLQASPSPPSSWSCDFCLTLPVLSTGSDSKPISKKFQLRGEHLNCRESARKILKQHPELGEDPSVVSLGLTPGPSGGGLVVPSGTEERGTLVAGETRRLAERTPTLAGIILLARKFFVLTSQGLICFFRKIKTPLFPILSCRRSWLTHFFCKRWTLTFCI